MATVVSGQNSFIFSKSTTSCEASQDVCSPLFVWFHANEGLRHFYKPISYAFTSQKKIDCVFK